MKLAKTITLEAERMCNKSLKVAQEHVVNNTQTNRSLTPVEKAHTIAL